MQAHEMASPADAIAAGLGANQSGASHQVSTVESLPAAASTTRTADLVAALRPIIERVRTDVTCIKKDGKQAWTRQPLTEARIEQHLGGKGPARGCCPIKAGESTTRLALLDMDSHKGETPWPEMQRAALLVIDELNRRGLHVTPFRSSGGRGVHLFLLWDAPQDAYSVRQFLVDVLGSLGYRNGTEGVIRGEIEIFPKQDSVPVDGFGNQFILPLAGASVPLEVLVGLDPMPRDWVTMLPWTVSPPVPVLEKPTRAPRAEGQEGVGDGQLGAALAAIPNDGADSMGRDGWFNVLCSIKEAAGENGRDAALAWSLQHPSHIDANFDKAWDSISIGKENGTPAEYVFSLAERHGWQERIASEFEAVAPVATEPPPLPSFTRTKAGEIHSTDDNVTKALRRPDLCGFRIGFDQFRDEIMLAQAGTEDWRPFTDADYTRASIALERASFKTTGSDRMRSCVRLVADEHRFDSAGLWLGSLAWDGRPRVEHFLTRYAGAEDSAYICAVSLYLFSAMAGRVMVPGIKADMAPVLVGPQGAGKSSLVAALVPAPEHYIEISFHEDESTLGRKMRGVLLGELAELRGLKTKELEGIKTFITRTHEKWVPKWQEFAKEFPRRLVFIGTTNADEFLADETGNRRWLPVRVGRVDVAAIRRDHLQLWAEARELFKADGIAYQGAEKLASEAHQAHMITDAWESAISKWLACPAVEFYASNEATESNGTRPFRMGEVLAEALHLTPRDQNMATQYRAAKVLRKLGYQGKQMTVGGERGKFWTRGAL